MKHLLVTINCLCRESCAITYLSVKLKRGTGSVARHSLATLENRSSIPGAGNHNVLVTKSDWPTLVILVC